MQLITGSCGGERCINMAVTLREIIKQVQHLEMKLVAGETGLDHEVSFSKDQSGQYQFDGYKTTLQNELKPEEHRSQYFKIQGRVFRKFKLYYFSLSKI